MAAEQGDQDRTEEATPFKLEEARRRGQVFKSVEINSLAILGLALLAATAFGLWTIYGVLQLSRDIFREAGTLSLSVSSVTKMFHWISNQGLFILSPLLVLAVIGAVLANFLQTGPVFSFFPLKPDFTRLNPAQGFKRVFSMRSLYEGLKSILKFALLAGVVYAVVRHFLPELFSLMQRSMSAYPGELQHIATFSLLAMLIGFTVLAFGDNAYSRWEFRKKMRMSRRELRDEVRRREGDPQIKSRRRQLLSAMRKNAKSTARVGDADLLITNPTHVAVALQYDRGSMPAPRLISKGAGDLALKMRRMAYHHGVTVVESPVLARRLYREVEIDGFIPPDTYQQVAGLIKPILQARRPTKASP
ncbi:MAG: EscU/YscU/HrcU family type III secretion system export apparatus switch protein [Solimonas sp.]